MFFSGNSRIIFLWISFIFLWCKDSVTVTWFAEIEILFLQFYTKMSYYTFFIFYLRHMSWNIFQHFRKLENIRRVLQQAQIFHLEWKTLAKKIRIIQLIKIQGIKWKLTFRKHWQHNNNSNWNYFTIGYNEVWKWFVRGTKMGWIYAKSKHWFEFWLFDEENVKLGSDITALLMLH